MTRKTLNDEAGNAPETEELDRPVGLPEGFEEAADLPITGWEDAQGALIVGNVLAVRPAGLGKVLDLLVDGRLQTFGCPRILERKLAGRIGQDVGLLCTGKNVETANGLAWGFRVFFKDSGDQPF